MDEHILNTELLSNHFGQYVQYCQRSSWLTYHEAYKFKFARWLNQRIDFDNQSDQEILAICKSSQEQQYDESPSYKGLNFILSARRFKDDFIVESDIALMRKINDGGKLINSDLRDSPLTFPKFSVWLATILPHKYDIYASDELRTSIPYLYGLEAITTQGAEGFYLTNKLLSQIRKHLTTHFEKEIEQLIAVIFPGDPEVKQCDVAWLVQDFTLYLSRMVLNRQIKYYWVNQGSSYKKELEAGIIAAPTSSHKHHKRLNELREGDKIIHYSEGAIRATSAVKKEFVIGPRPYNLKEYGGEEVYIVEVVYSELAEPIALEEIQKIIKDHVSVLPKKYSPLNKKLGVNQSYCCMFTEEAYDLLFGLDKEEEALLISRLKDIGLENAEVFYEVADSMIKSIRVQQGDARVTYNLPSNHLIGITVGQRYCLTTRKKQQGIEWGFIQDPEDSEHWWQNTFDTEEARTNKELITKNAAIELARSKKSSYREDHNSQVLEKTIFDPSYRAEILNKAFEKSLVNEVNEPINMNYPQNIILYGPPGTGKTYHTINHALEICGEDLTGLDRPEIKRRYNQRVKDGQIVFTTFHQSMSYEDFIEGIKPLEPEEEGGQVIYKIVDGIFKKACIEAAFNFAEEHASDQKEMQLDFSLAYDQFKEEIEEELALENQVILKTKSGGNIYVDGITSQGNMLIKHKDGVRAYVVSKPRLSKLNKAISDLEEIPNIYGTFGKIIGGSNASAYWAVLNAIRKNKNIPKENKQIQREYSWEDKVDVVQSLDSEIFKVKTAKPVVVIIDEINRGNVSSIFGELITLIETDKRLGQPEELLNVLPYSKEPFGVPPNLYIIGTMNTADRSVEALDTALRRRFSFIEMLPNPKKLADQDKMKDIDLEKLLETINKRVELLIDRDHTIGHSYFMNINSPKELAEVFKDKVVPLLQEYFYGDFGKIGLVLGKKFIQKNENNKVQFADFPYENPEDYKNDTYTLEDINEANIVDAVSELLRTKESE